MCLLRASRIDEGVAGVLGVSNWGVGADLEERTMWGKRTLEGAGGGVVRRGSSASSRPRGPSSIGFQESQAGFRVESCVAMAWRGVQHGLLE